MSRIRSRANTLRALILCSALATRIGVPNPVEAQTKQATRAQSKNTPALAETLQWMQNTLSSGDGNTIVKTEKRLNLMPSAASCDVSFEYQTQSLPSRQTTYRSTYTFNLKNIDPASIVVYPSGGDILGPTSLVSATTTNKANLIALRSGDEATPTDSWLVEFGSPYANRFAKAFTLAVKMCGGKPSFFADSDGRDGVQRTPRATAVGAEQSTPTRKDIPAIAKAANGAIVSIIMSDKNAHAIAKGTGFLVSKDGRIVTNYHVIAEGSSAKVKLPDGSLFAVDGVLAFDKVRDVALIKAHGENFRTLTLGNSDRLQVGEDVVAIGNPLSLESTVSNGIVSGIRTDDERGGKFLQVTTPISPGSSGGPLFNMMGEVVGITTLYLEGGENLNFAIPINDAKRLLLRPQRLVSLPNEPMPDESSKKATKVKPEDVSHETPQQHCDKRAEEYVRRYFTYEGIPPSGAYIISVVSLRHPSCTVAIIFSRDFIGVQDATVGAATSESSFGNLAWEGVFEPLHALSPQDRQALLDMFPNDPPDTKPKITCFVGSYSCASKEHFDHTVLVLFGLDMNGSSIPIR